MKANPSPRANVESSSRQESGDDVLNSIQCKKNNVPVNRSKGKEKVGGEVKKDGMVRTVHSVTVAGEKNERLRLVLQEQKQQQLLLLLRKVESKVMPKLKQKDEEIARAAKRIVELEDFLKRLEFEKGVIAQSRVCGAVSSTSIDGALSMML
ncbi:BOI-related E3 ubiquitin-protein ligase [Salix suchowensis]|nr:BOI-related E3 ubiquitin-protein ligase [Salix suchowensis]